MLQPSVFLWRRLAAVAVLSSSSASHRCCLIPSSCISHTVSRGTTTTRGFAAAATPNDNNNDMSSPSNDNNKEETCRIDTSSSPHVTIHHFGPEQPVASTQDEARKLLQQQQLSTNSVEGPYLAVLADRQTNGRGTKGRTWEGGVGNLYLTLCLPLERLPVLPTLLPLQVAVVVAQRAHEALQGESKTTPVVSVKWPNDVLIQDQKLAGTLIESEIVDNVTWLLIGIGVNIEYAPRLEQTPGKHGRGVTCLREYNPNIPTAAAFGTDVAVRLVQWMRNERGIDKATLEHDVVQKWKSWAKFDQVYELRGSVEEETAGRHQGENVTTLDIEYDGQLRVRGADGRERLLIADYLF